MFVNGVINDIIYKTDCVCCCLPHFMLSVTKFFVAVEGHLVYSSIGTCLNLPCTHMCIIRVWWHQAWWRQFVYIYM